MTPPLSDASPANGSFQYHFSDEDLKEFSWQLDDHHHHHPPAATATEGDAEVPAVASTATPGTTSKPPQIPPTVPTEIAKPELSLVSSSKPDASRAQRKRSREKQRRCDINNQFSDLQQTLRSIEVERNSTQGMLQTNNRVDLIARTKALLEELHEETKKQKTEKEALEKDLADTRKIAEDTAARLKEATLYHPGVPQKQVMMMVPMMVPAGATPGSTATVVPATGTTAATTATTTTDASGSGTATPTPPAVYAVPQPFMPSPFMGMMQPGMQPGMMPFMQTNPMAPHTGVPAPADGTTTTSPVWKNVHSSSTTQGGNLAHCA